MPAPTSPPTLSRRPAPWVVPSWADPVVATATGLIGGPTGRWAAIGARGLAGVAAALVALSAVTLALSVWAKGHCLTKGWSTPDMYWRMCYSDLPVVQLSSRLATRDLPWAGPTPSDQPALSGLAMWLIAQVAPSVGNSLAAQRWALVLWAMVCVLLLAAAVLAAVALHPRRPWQAAHLAASPVVVASALVSTDLLGVTLSLLGLWAWRRDRPLLAGTLLGLAALVRPYPVVLLVACALLALRRHERRRALDLVLSALLVPGAVVLALAGLEEGSLTAFTSWGWPSHGALQLVPQLLGEPLGLALGRWIAVTGWLVAVALASWLVVSGRRVSEVQLAAMMLGIVALTAPSLSAQAGLWLLPLLALSARPWWEHLTWAFVETLHFGATWLHLAFGSDPGRGLPPGTYAIAVVLRAAAWAWIIWRVCREPARRQAPLGPRRGPAV